MAHGTIFFFAHPFDAAQGMLGAMRHALCAMRDTTDHRGPPIAEKADSSSRRSSK
jgi:hypothetical protein